MNTDLFFTIYDLTGRAPWLNKIVFFVAQHLDNVMIAIIAIALVAFFIHDKDWRPRRFHVWLYEVFAIGCGTVGAWLIAVTVKAIVAAPRPFVIFSQVQPLVVETPYTSFPSGHATVFFALAMAVYMYHKKLGYFFFICAFLISLSRVMAGVHYPVDVIFGAAIGIFIAWLSTTFFQKKV